MKTLITGGLGYIGSHIAYKLGPKSVIIDDMSNSNLNFKKLLPKSIVYKKKINKSSLDKIFNENKIDSVIHLAGFKAVNESINFPLKYYENNLVNTIDLISSMEKYKINKLIFSSSATVYGLDNINKCPLKETFKSNAINPYGNTKIIIEDILDDYCKANKNFKAISLRYFNPIGANLKSGLCEKPIGKTQNLMPNIIKCLKERKPLKIYGNNYNTPDGTCVRDYIHVDDLAEAHIKSIKMISKIGKHEKINIGLGRGISVMEIIKIFEKVNKLKINFTIKKPRIGDSAISYADNKKAIKLLKWKSKKNYKDMCKDSWEASFK